MGGFRGAVIGIKLPNDPNLLQKLGLQLNEGKIDSEENFEGIYWNGDVDVEGIHSEFLQILWPCCWGTWQRGKLYPAEPNVYYGVGILNGELRHGLEYSIELPNTEELYEEMSANLKGLYSFEKRDIKIHVTEHICGCS